MKQLLENILDLEIELRAFITQVKKDLNGPQIFLSRTCNEFMAALIFSRSS